MSWNPRPGFVPPPGETIADALEDRGWTQEDLAQIMGRPLNAINAIIRGRKQITAETAVGLGEAFGTSAELWSNLEAQYQLHRARQSGPQASVARRAELRGLVNYRQVARNGWIQDTNDVDKLEAELLALAGAASLEKLAQPAALYRHSTTKEVAKGALAVWCGRVRRLAAQQTVAAFDQAAFAAAVPALPEWSIRDEGVAEAPAVLAEHGVHFVLVPHLDRTYLDGALLRQNGNPIIALTLRHDRLDNFWFTLLHEAAHLVADHEGDRLDDTDERNGDEQEAEANRLAQEWLIPAARYHKFVREQREGGFSADAVTRFAAAVRRHPSIVVGRLQYDGHLGYGQLRGLQAKVRGWLEERMDRV